MVRDLAETAFGALHGLYWLTANLADHGPLMMAVDDAHWADPSSLQFLGYLLRRLQGLPVLLVAAGRGPDPEGDPLWQELVDDPAAEVLRPRALSPGRRRRARPPQAGRPGRRRLRRGMPRGNGGQPAVPA